MALDKTGLCSENNGVDLHADLITRFTESPATEDTFKQVADVLR